MEAGSGEAARSVMAGIPSLIVLMALTFAAGAFGGAAAGDSAGFYEQLARPVWAPPAWLFGPVWTVLYALIGISAFLVVRERGWVGAAGLLAVFALQLVANSLWTWLFFRWHSGVWAFADIVALVVLIIVMIISFWRVRPLAGALLVPYLVWVLFATALTWSLWRGNPTAL